MKNYLSKKINLITTTAMVLSVVSAAFIPAFPGFDKNHIISYSLF